MKHNERWNDIRSEVKNTWGHLSAEDIEARGENISALSELIQEKYGDTEETVIERLEAILKQFGPTTEDIKNLKSAPGQPVKDLNFTI